MSAIGTQAEQTLALAHIKQHQAHRTLANPTSMHTEHMHLPKKNTAHKYSWPKSTPLHKTCPREVGATSSQIHTHKHRHTHRISERAPDTLSVWALRRSATSPPDPPRPVARGCATAAALWVAGTVGQVLRAVAHIACKTQRRRLYSHGADTLMLLCSVLCIPSKKENDFLGVKKFRYG